MASTFNWLWQQAKTTVINHLKRAKIAAGAVIGIIAALLATPAIIGAAGFGAAGPVAGSLAVAWQASIGNVAAGSAFAILQSAAMGGTGAAIVTTVAAIGGAVVGAAGGAVGGAVTDVVTGVEDAESSDNEDDSEDDNDSIGEDTGLIKPKE